MRIATHDGSFHADDCFALAALGLLGEPIDLVRSRDPEVLASADLRVDVGLRDDPSSGDFDHHQRGGAGERANGIRFASFGLVWKHYGPRVCDGSQAVADDVDAALVQTIDAHDNGQEVAQAIVQGVWLGGVSAALGMLNPVWDEDGSAEVQLARFEEAVAIARRLLEGLIAASAARSRATALVEAAIARSDDPRVVVLDRGMPWHEPIVGGAPEALYVVLPKSSGWGVQCVPVAPGSFDNRKPLPESWAGLSDDALAAETGVAEARFCHPGRFLAVARSREGADALVALALAA